MADPSRLEDLRRRVQREPASLVFAQLAEEHRRAGEHHEAVRVCRTGLSRHPEYLSARVTLGRALLALGQFTEAQHELEAVLRVAPGNIAARRDLGELFRREDRLPEALVQLRSALELAPQDAELAASVEALERQVPPPAEPVRAAPETSADAPAAAPQAPAMVFTTNAGIDLAASAAPAPAADPAPAALADPAPAAPADGAPAAPADGAAAAPADRAPGRAPPPVTDAPPSDRPAGTTPMLAHLEGWLARLEADRRARDGSATGE